MTARDRTVEEALDVLGTVPHTVIGTLTGIHPDAKHADNCPGCMAQDALATVRA
ncbi:MAG: hypothetical protein IT374_08965, partial [Polyangiaceae bacterium]|nr:hypothetical protein [Polyangiaceae bacterium]